MRQRDASVIAPSHFAHASWRARQGAVRLCLKRIVGTKASAVERARQWFPAGALKVRPKEPVRSAGIAAGRQHVVPEAAITHRDLGPGIEIGASPRNHDNFVVTVAVGNDRRGWLDDGAAGGALDNRLRRERLPFLAARTAAKRLLKATLVSGRTTEDMVPRCRFHQFSLICPPATAS